jgi:glycosyltransferase involved in cell wall biosynthesis
MIVWLGHLARLGFDRLVPDCDLFHGMEHLLLPLRHCPTVLTVHDMIFHLFPQHHKRLNRWYLNAALPAFCRNASAVICVSRRTKEDLVRIWGIDPAKTHIVYEAADSQFRPVSDAAVMAVKERFGLPERYLLTVGTIEPRKNLNRLLDALALLQQRNIDVHLVVVGSLGWLYQDFLNRLEQFEHRRSVILTGFVPDSDLPAVYSGATATVLPSIYEGFGLPVLESMACGTPVLSSNAASLPELGGEAARYFDPLNVDELAEAISDVWSDSELGQRMRHMGLKQAARFSWERAALETMRVYEKAGAKVA